MPYLKAWQEWQKGLADSVREREKAAKYLTVKTGFVEKAKQRATSLTRQQEVEAEQELALL